MHHTETALPSYEASFCSELLIVTLILLPGLESDVFIAGAELDAVLKEFKKQLLLDK